MLLIPENRADIDKYYKNTFVKFSEYSKYNPDMVFDPDTLFYIEKVYPNKITGITQDEIAFEIFFDNETPLTLKYPLPHKSFFQVDKRACMLTRIPARQYKRGICADNTSIFSVKKDGSLGAVNMNFKTLQAYVNKPVFYSLSEATKNKKSYESLTLSPRLALVQATQSIFVDTVPVALLQGTAIKMVKNQFKPELKAFLTANAEESNYTVEDL